MLYGSLAAAIAASAIAGVASRPLTAQPSSRLQIGDLTWVQVRSDVQRGFKTVLVPSGGNEQNGVHMAIGKHDMIVRAAADDIARKLGDTLVAPVIAYVPEGDPDKREGHFQYPGTMGVSDATYAAMLDGVARSLKAAGFTTICLLGDHGGSEPVQGQVARRLSAEWAKDGVRVIDVGDYYAAGSNAQVAWLKRLGETDASIGEHAGIQDTSELMAVQPGDVDLGQLALARGRWARTGASGDAARSTPERGRQLLALRVDAAVRQIRRETQARSVAGGGHA